MELVEVRLLEVAELGLQVFEVLRDTLVFLCQPHVRLRILLLVLRIALLQTRTPTVAGFDIKVPKAARRPPPAFSRRHAQL